MTARHGPPRPASPTLLHSLRVFVACARLASFKAAAETLHLTSSAVSHRIASLERHLGVRLFVRKTRAIELTTPGRELLDAAETALAELDRSLERVTVRAVRRTLRIYAAPLFAHELLVPALGRYLGLQPSVDVRLGTETELPTEHPATVDVSFLLLDRPPARAAAIELFSPRYVAAATRPVAAIARELGPRLFERQRAIVFRHRPDLWAAWAAACGWPDARPKSIVEVDSMQAAVVAAESGLGVALLPRALLPRSFDGGRLAALSDVEVAGVGTYYVVSRPRDVQRPEVRTFRLWATSVFGEGEGERE